MNVQNPHMLKNSPVGVSIIMNHGRIMQDEFLITKIHLRQYVHKKNDTYSVITAYVETDKGTVEMTYDEGYLGKKPLESATRMLVENLGPSALILRCTIALREQMAAAKNNDAKEDKNNQNKNKQH